VSNLSGMAKNTFELLRRLVSEVQCKPGWSFSLLDEDGALRLVITVPGFDALRPHYRFTVQHYHPVPTTTFNAKSWRRWIFDQCMRTETHEVSEWLRFGEGDSEIRPFLPTHGPGEDPYQNREYRNEDDAFTTQDGSMRGGVGPSGIRPEPMAEPYQQRVVDEKRELAEKYRKLHEFIAGETFRSLPIEEQDRLNRQQLIMLQYNDVLGERIAAFE
jgi:hypothetical protein